MMKEMLEKKLKEVKPQKMSGMEVSSKKEFYPTVHFDSKALPEIKDWKVDGEYYLVLKVKQTSSNKSEEGMSANFDVIELGVMDDMEEEADDDKTKSIKEKYGV